jgi:hypothetical protein
MDKNNNHGGIASVNIIHAVAMLLSCMFTKANHGVKVDDNNGRTPVILFSEPCKPEVLALDSEF